MAGTKELMITMTVGKLAAGAILIVAGAWGAMALTLSLTFSGVREDITAIRASLDGVQKTETANRIETDLRGQLNNLVAELEKTNGNLGTTNAQLSALVESTSSLNQSIQTMDSKLTSSIFRQQDFERWVITRLGTTDAPLPTDLSLPEGWTEQQIEVLKAVKSGSEPLSNWLKYTNIKQ